MDQINTIDSQKLPIPVVSYQKRVAKIKTLEDCGYQLKLAKITVRRLERELKRQVTPEDKKRYTDAVNRARRVLRRFRQNIFTLEDKFQ
jgi:hypothetical protein